MNEILNLIKRLNKLFEQYLEKSEEDFNDKVLSSSFLVLGGAGSIGQALTDKIYKS